LVRNADCSWNSWRTYFTSPTFKTFLRNVGQSVCTTTDANYFNYRISTKFWCNQIESGQTVYCTWSGQQIKKTDDLAIDHAIPFSVLFNNDFWNLLPAKNAVNANKTDKILSKTQLLASKSRILTAWQQYLQTPELADTFAAQCQISLTKAPIFTPEDLLEKFQEINVGFVELRGMESWEA
jgi:hypothetical protein